MTKVWVDKGKCAAVKIDPTKKGRKDKKISVNKNGKISKSKGVQSGKGKAKNAASRAKKKALAIKQSYPRGKTRAELVESMGLRKCTNSTGLFGSMPPSKPTRVDISNGV